MNDEELYFHGIFSKSNNLVPKWCLLLNTWRISPELSFYITEIETYHSRVNIETDLDKSKLT